MVYTYKGNDLGSFFGMSDNYPIDSNEYASYKNLISIIWNRSDKDATVIVDGVDNVLKKNFMTTTTYFQKVTYKKGNSALVAFSFNREFYCINDHDHEVSCNGIIFMGRQESPIIKLSETEAEKFEILYHVFKEEFFTRDNIQGEMLQMLLKRLIIKVTRIAKEQLMPSELKDSQIDIIRKFNVFVDMHYKEKRQVSDYAELLFKSPKTLSNLFAKYNDKTPLQVIHERIVLEAKRLLLYSDKSAKEIAHDLNFDDPAAFHKLFKKVLHLTPQEFKQTKSREIA